MGDLISMRNQNLAEVANMKEHYPDTQDKLARIALALRDTNDVLEANAGMRTIQHEELKQMLGHLGEMLQSMASMVQVTNERMTEIEKTLRTLEKVTPYQAKTINRLVRDRAAEVCREYRMPGQEKKVAGAIRRTVRELTGVKSAQEIARCDYQTVLETVGNWDRYDVIKKIRKAARGT